MNLFGGSAAGALKMSIEDQNRQFEKEFKSHDKSIAKNEAMLIYLNVKVNETTIIVSDTTIKADETGKIIENLLVENKYYNSLSINNSIVDELRENVSRLIMISENHTTPTIPAVNIISTVIGTPLPTPKIVTH
jgi:hypothetical protein